MTLRDAGVALLDCDHRTPPAAESGYPYVAIPQMHAGRINFHDARRISAEHFAEWTRKTRPQPNDVVLSRRCNPGETAIVDEGQEFALGQNLVLLRSDGSCVEPRFLRWLVRGPLWSRQVEKFINVGAVFDSLRCADVPKFELPIPPINQQRAIAHILGTLDDKIELNRRMSETLEAMARAVYDKWFDRAWGRRDVQEAIASGDLEIGDGYRAKNEEMGEPGVPFVRAGDLREQVNTDGAELLRRDVAEKAMGKRGRPGDVAFTSKGTIGRLARVTPSTPAFIYSPQVCFWRSLKQSRLDPSVLYHWMESADFLAQVRAVAGQTDMAPYVSLRDQRRMTMPLFPESQAQVAQSLNGFLSRRDSACEESRTLAALRDTLLPKLISGELRIKDAERVVQAAI